MSDLDLAIAIARAKKAKTGGVQSDVRSRVANALTSQPSQDRLDATAEANRQAEAQIVQSGTGGKFGGFVAKANQGLPLVGEWIDEGIDAINPGAGERIRAAQDAFDVTNPKTALAAEIGGGVVGSMVAAPLAVERTMRAPTMVGKVARGMGLGAAAGAVEGASQGAGAAEPGQRVEGGITGAQIGGTLGAVLGGLAPVGAKGVEALVKRVKRLDVNTISDQLGISKNAARVVRGALQNDDLDAAAAALARGGDDAMLADAGPASRALLDASQQTGGEALSVSRNRVNQRVTQQGQRFRQSLDDILGEPMGVNAAAREISQRTAPARQAAYDRAFAQPIDYSGPGRKIESVLERIPPRTLKNAIEEANEAMIADGKTNMQILADIADDGSVSFREMPNVQQLNQIKIELGNIAAGEVDQFGRKTARGMRAQKLAGELRDAVSEAVPGYRAAVKLGGDKIAEDNALDLGRNLLSKRTTFEDVITQLRDAGPQAKDAARRGLRENIDNIMENARTTLGEIEAGNFDFEIGQNAAKEALDALRALTTPANFKKARAVLGPDAKRLFFELERTSDAMTLRAAVARNSATAIRREITSQARDQVQPGIIRRALGNMGNPLDGAKEVTQSIAGIDPASMTDRQREIFAEIADILTSVRGQEAQQALAAVRSAMQGQPLKDAQAREIGQIVAGAVASGGYQTPMQYQY